MPAMMLLLAWAYSLHLVAAVAVIESTSVRTEMNIHYNVSRNYLIEGETTPDDFITCCALGFSSSYYSVQLVLDRTKLGETSTRIVSPSTSNSDFRYTRPAANCSNGMSFNFSISNVKKSYEGVYYCRMYYSPSVTYENFANAIFVPVYSNAIVILACVRLT